MLVVVCDDVMIRMLKECLVGDREFAVGKVYGCQFRTVGLELESFSDFVVDLEGPKKIWVIIIKDMPSTSGALCLNHC